MHFSQPQYFTTPECYQPAMHSQTPAGNLPNWNFEGTRLSYGSAAEPTFINDDMITTFLMNDNDAGPSTQPQHAEPQNEEQHHGMRLQANRQAPHCGTHQRFTRPGQDPH